MVRHANQEQIDEIDAKLAAPIGSPTDGTPDEFAAILARAVADNE